MRGAMRGLADGLDADSAYLTAEEAGLYESGRKAGAGETGIELTRGYYLRVIAVRDGSPAAKAGLQGGDFLRAIDGKPTREMSVFEGPRLLRGAPGSKVSLIVIRGNAADPHTVDVAREVPAGLDVTSRMLDGHDRLRADRGIRPGAAQGRVVRGGRTLARPARRRCSSTSATRPPAATTRASPSRGCSSRPARSRCKDVRGAGAPDDRGRAPATARSRCRPSCS